MDFPADIFILQLVLVSFCGSLLGEAVREIDGATSTTFPRFAVEFLAGGFIALMIAMVVKELFLRDRPLVVLPVTGILAFCGRKKAVEYCDRILNAILNKPT